MQSNPKLARRAEYEFSIGLRFTHWLRALAIVILTVSGFYIAYVFVSPHITGEPINFMNAKWRMVHQVAGFVLIGCVIFKSYLFLFDKKSKIERESWVNAIGPKLWIDQIKFYLFMGSHPHIKGTYNPLQFVAYIGFYAMIFVLCITGLVLYAAVYHEGLGGAIEPLAKWFEVLMGGLANTRIIHHIAMWGVLIFVFAHIYMATFNAIKGRDGAMDAIFSGYKFLKRD